MPREEVHAAEQIPRRAICNRRGHVDGVVPRGRAAPAEGAAVELRHDPVGHLAEGRLAGTRRTDQPRELANADVGRDGIRRLHLGRAVAEPDVAKAHDDVFRGGHPH